MREGSPGPTVGPFSEPERYGKARCQTGTEGRVLFRLLATDQELGERLFSLSEAGLFGFEEAGRDRAGLWLLRRKPAPELGSLLEGPELSPLRALRIVVAVARALAAAERSQDFPGPLLPSAVIVPTGASPPAWVRAEPWLGKLLEAEAAAAPSSEAESLRWLPPEQADGAPWDAAANRYALGLYAYRLLSGEHPFSGLGARLGLEEKVQRGAPPFPEARSKHLPPGLQSTCLAWLSARLEDRPASAQAMADALLPFLGQLEVRVPPEPPRVLDREPPAPPSIASSAPERAGRERGAARARPRSMMLLLGAGAVAVAAALSPVLGGAVGAGPAARRSIPRRPIPVPAHQNQDCASCHPRQTAEWERSVMAQSATSPLFQALEILIEEQVGRSDACPEGAGVLRRLDLAAACREPESGRPITGSGGEHWCVNCHSPLENLSFERPGVAAWDARSPASRSRRPLVDQLGADSLEGIGCAFCHQVHGPVTPGAAGEGRYEGNPFWVSTRNGTVFQSRPEDAIGVFGIANSGYSLDPELLGGAVFDGPPGQHALIPETTRRYLRSSEFCGACHDVRLFGTDVIGVQKGEHFKRLRNAYSEWRAFAQKEREAGRQAPSCQDCHMSTYPGVCRSGVRSGPPSAVDRSCPSGTHFVEVEPGALPEGLPSTPRGSRRPVYLHYFSGVDVPLSDAFPSALIDEPGTDGFGVPLGARQRRNLLLSRSIRMTLGSPEIEGERLRIPLKFLNRTGHRVPAGFSQERELWVHLRVTDARGRLVYEAGRVEEPTDDLSDKRFLRVRTDDSLRDSAGRPLGLFGADVADGPDVPRWASSGSDAAPTLVGRGLINFQNGFLRCVRCRGRLDVQGQCQPLPGQDSTRAGRYEDGEYDPDTGECVSNLRGSDRLFETYFPVGSLDASRGVLKGPDAIIDTRSLPPGETIRYTYDLSVQGVPPYRVTARLLFRAFPPFLLRAFIDYERRQTTLGRRPSGPLIGEAVMQRLDVVELQRASVGP